MRCGAKTSAAWPRARVLTSSCRTRLRTCTSFTGLGFRWCGRRSSRGVVRSRRDDLGRHALGHDHPPGVEDELLHLAPWQLVEPGHHPVEAHVRLARVLELLGVGLDEHL